MIAPPMHPVGLGFLRQASRPLHLLPRLSDPLTRDADKVHRALQAGSVLRCGVAGQLRHDLDPLWRTPLLAHAAKAVTSNWAGLR